MKRSYSLIFFIAISVLSPPALATATTPANQRHRMDYKNCSLGIDQVDHLHKPIADAAPLHVVLFTSTFRKASPRMIHYQFHLGNRASVLKGLFYVPINPPEIVPHED